MDFFILQYYGISTCNFLDFAFATFGIFILQQILGSLPIYPTRVNKWLNTMDITQTNPEE